MGLTAIYDCGDPCERGIERPPSREVTMTARQAAKRAQRHAARLRSAPTPQNLAAAVRAANETARVEVEVASTNLEELGRLSAARESLGAAMLVADRSLVARYGSPRARRVHPAVVSARRCSRCLAAPRARARRPLRRAASGGGSASDEEGSADPPPRSRRHHFDRLTPAPAAVLR